MGGACGMGRKNADGKKPLARPRSRLGTVLKKDSWRKNVAGRGLDSSFSGKGKVGELLSTC
jgi:hypothetical protein